MQILVTGATGFIGRHLVRYLVADGHAVSILSRDPNRAAALLPEAATYFAWERDAQPPQDAIAAAQTVIHLAGESVDGRWTAAKKSRIASSRTQGTRLLVEALASASGRRALVCASAVGYYGDRSDEELTEQSAPGKGFLADVVQNWEREARAAEQTGCRVAVMRTGIVLGRDGGALPKILPIFRLGLGGPIGGGSQWWPWVHVDDVAGALAAAATQSWSGTFNLVAPEPVPERDFAEELGHALKRPVFAPVPAFALRLIQGEFADEVLFSKRVLPARLLEAGYRFGYPTLGPALAQLLQKEDAGAPLSIHA
jgi:uncharacterized protein (TIGR01777 family)